MQLQKEKKEHCGSHAKSLRSEQYFDGIQLISKVDTSNHTVINFDNFFATIFSLITIFILHPVFFLVCLADFFVWKFKLVEISCTGFISMIKLETQNGAFVILSDKFSHNSKILLTNVKAK